nr:MAG TPA: hypothetical protein [Caudoviricetes sp.]
MYCGGIVLSILSSFVYRNTTHSYRVVYVSNTSCTHLPTWRVINHKCHDLVFII